MTAGVTLTALNVRKFNTEIQRWVKNAQPAIQIAFAKFIAVQALRQVVKKSPVDTGLFRGNWQASKTGLGAPTQFKDKQPLGSEPMQQTIRRAFQNMVGLRVGMRPTVFNALPYAKALNDGHSLQAQPAGFIGRAMTDIRARKYRLKDLISQKELLADLKRAKAI